MTVTNFESSRKIIILCDCCFQEITNYTRIKCECGIDMCVLCYFHQKTAKNHTVTHRYYAIEPLNYTLIESSWTALEELIFFEMLIQHGLGNWTEIALNLKTKSSQEIESHFYKVFGININKEYDSDTIISEPSNPNYHYVSVYAPKRKDFDFEDEYEYEMNLKSLDVGENEIVKNFLLDAYKNLLVLRKYKRMIILEKGLTRVQEIKASKDGTDSGLFYKVAPLAQFISKKDFNLFLAGLSIEKYLLDYKGVNKRVKHDFFEIERLRMNILQPSERELCRRLKITYGSYMKLKRYAVLEQIRTKNVSVKALGRIVKGSDSRVGILHSFFKKNGWI
ncbi:Histone acetyltransferase complex SAGA/ADA, subunit ADA2 [Trachipleistophora hominis]|uniref:Histone acetyltransferase complex SAGA/ADA, subunit ADA2 n=1 Tax=Trachipleistophora hominis TaxID=72359 RepID=L7JXG4_TRAHO|nr:Histone acetyltransferase complex SAGA/ADA, subunit ADA2 [Trachipleistophora hominis]